MNAITKANAEEMINQYLKATLKPGDSVALAFRNDGSLFKIKRVNKNGVTFESGTKWGWSEIIPTKDGKELTTAEFSKAVRDYHANA